MQNPIDRILTVPTGSSESETRRFITNRRIFKLGAGLLAATFAEGVAESIVSDFDPSTASDIKYASIASLGAACISMLVSVYRFARDES